MTFQEFNFNPELVDGLSAMGYTKPTPIQEQSIPVILHDRDLIACAQTGTGKTAAYLLPILHKIVNSDHRHLNTLVIAPTRELALQIDQQIEALGYFINVSSITVYGGGSGIVWEQQKRAMQLGTDIVIATPGRLLSMLNVGDINFKHLEHLVLDEADRMLDMGFYDDIVRIISYLPEDRQTILFSATMPPKIRTLANQILKDPAEINIAISKPADGILQMAYMTYDNQKFGLLKHIFQEKEYKSVIIFCSRKETVKRLANELKRIIPSLQAFHSDLEQEQREEIMRNFKNKQLQVLVGTDILSRGIDVEGIDLVINYDVPPDGEDYIHRIGRTARAATTGTAITLINDMDQQRFASIERLIGREIPKTIIPAALGEGPAYTPGIRRSGGGGRGAGKPQQKRHGGNKHSHSGSGQHKHGGGNGGGQNQNRQQGGSGEKRDGQKHHHNKPRHNGPRPPRPQGEGGSNNTPTPPAPPAA
ncbi:MAG: DEAD/DEAH box helicase [Bacteroidetes bacterium]|nr:DEAD/DEAH box helicase [Bacteroidota bacterium]